MIVASSPCTEGCINGTTLYLPDRSSTAQSSARELSLVYGSGRANGTVYTDAVSLMNYTTSQQFVACSQLENLLYSPVSGLLGLGLQALAVTGAQPLIEQLARSGALPEPVFSLSVAFYTGVANGPPAAEVYGGEFTIGTIPANSSDINWWDILSTSS